MLFPNIQLHISLGILQSSPRYKNKRKSTPQPQSSSLYTTYTHIQVRYATHSTSAENRTNAAKYTFYSCTIWFTTVHSNTTRAWPPTHPHHSIWLLSIFTIVPPLFPLKSSPTRLPSPCAQPDQRWICTRERALATQPPNPAVRWWCRPWRLCETYSW